MLDDMNLNPLAKENLQTAAFLGALSIGKQIAGIPLKIGGKTKLGVKLSEGLSSLEKSHPTIANGLKQANNVGAELGAMLIAEQVMNLTFGHDVLDPVTWEITTERALRRPDNQEWATMIGMILAFQVIKPNLYERLTQRLNNWTLEIYRTTNPNNPRIKNTITGETIPLKEVPQKAESFLNEKKSEKTQKEQKADSNGGTQKERQQKTTETQASTEQLKQKQERMEQLLKEMQAEYNEITALESRINKLKSKNPQSDKLNRREQNLKARKENYNKKSAEYSKLKTEQNQYMKHNTQSSSVETWQNKSESPYFEGKRSKLGLTETQARQNSETMDILVSKIKAGERKVSDLQKMADQIKSQYQQTTGKQLNNFTVENLMQVIQAHTLPWEIGKLSHAELRHKYEALNRSIADPLVKRFLLEAGFCGQREIFKPTSPEKINELVSHFDKQIMSAEGIIHNGNVYRLQFESNISQNQARKWTRKLSINGETRMTVKVKAESSLKTAMEIALDKNIIN